MTRMALDDVRAITDPARRARAAKAFAEASLEASKDANVVRDQAIVELLRNHTQKQVAELIGMSVSLVTTVSRAHANAKRAAS